MGAWGDIVLPAFLFWTRFFSILESEGVLGVVGVEEGGGGPCAPGFLVHGHDLLFLGGDVVGV